MEGGAVDFNGAGTVLTTDVVPAEQEPQPELSKTQIEQYLKDYYGQTHVVWLGDGSRATTPTATSTTWRASSTRRTIVIGVEDDPKDANYRVLPATRGGSSTSCAIRMAGRSRSSRSRCPAPVEHDGQRLPATYVNFYFVNGALLVPTFGDRT